MHIWRLENQLLQQDSVFVRRDEQEDWLSGIDEQMEGIKNDIDMFGDRILELESSNTSGDSKEHSDADLAGVKALLELTMGDGGSEGLCLESQGCVTYTVPSCSPFLTCVSTCEGD
jgi:hypothetical protein